MPTKKTRAVNLRTEPYDVYIGRAGHGHDGYFGNPYPLTPGAPRGTTLDYFRNYFANRLATDPEFFRRIQELRGKRLGCFCKPAPCHGDIIAAYLNSTEPDTGNAGDPDA